MADFGELEAREGLRLTWNVWPNTKIEATKCVLPFAAILTPCKKYGLDVAPVVPYQPVPCRSCGAVLNPYARVDFAGKIWVCPFCFSRNQFPPHYNAITESNLPAELFPNYSAIEYTIPKPGGAKPPAYLFVVDTCVSEDELDTCKGALLQALTLLPEDALVGLVTYGTHVHVHELGFTECSKSWVFRGGSELDPRKIAAQLGISSASSGPQQHHGANGVGAPRAQGPRFLMPLSECEFVLSDLLENLSCDAFPVPSDKRAARCTGSAVQVAVTVAGGTLAPGGSPARIMLFVGGPSTEGKGAVVPREKVEAIRSHKDVAKDAAPYFGKAVQFYDRIAHELVLHGHSLDVFACALDQIGLAEMKPAIERSGGMVVLAESYHHDTFKDSLKKIFTRGEEGLGVCSHGTVEVVCSKDIKVSGCIGPCAPLDKKSPLVSETQVGMGGTTVWRLCGLDPSTSVCVFFDIVGGKEGGPAPAQQGPAAQGQQLFLQFQTKYTNAQGEGRMRVVTVTRHWVDGNQVQDLLAGFDQEAAAVVMSRLLSLKMEQEEDFNATRWLDRALIRLCSRFGDYRPEDPASFQLSPQMSIYPQFMFNLRRSQFVQVFNNSPDETAYFRMVLCREDCFNSLVMIQPTLTSYSFNGPPEPALLDVASIAQDRILLLDAYFQVVVFHGTTIAQWRKAEYHKKPEHEAFAQLLSTPAGDAQAIIKERFPVPRLVDCDQGGSQARFLLAKLNPSATYNNQMNGGGGTEVIMTDDVSLQVFMDHLRKLAVQPS